MEYRCCEVTVKCTEFLEREGRYNYVVHCAMRAQELGSQSVKGENFCKETVELKARN